jgi:hypothetical protein
MPYDFACQILPAHTSSGHCPACQNSESDAIIKARWSGSSEPQHIYWLFFSANAVSDWIQYMSKWRPTLRYAGIFVHQRPYCYFNPHGLSAITLTSSHSCHCELGDLLVVFTDNAARRRVATLCQAKMAGGGWPPISPNPDQWELYTHWPAFRYTPRSPSGSPGPQLRNLPFAGGNDPAAQYLELDSVPPSVATTQAISPAFWNVWDQTVNRILNGGAGRDFSWDRASAANDWDELIWDLLDYTHKCAIPVSVSGGSGGTRGVGTLLKFSTFFDVTEGNGPVAAAPEGQDDGWGIPIIYLTQGESVSS